MFKNVGEKLKEISDCIFWILSVLGIMTAFILGTVMWAITDNSIIGIVFGVGMGVFYIYISYAIALVLYCLSNIEEKYNE